MAESRADRHVRNAHGTLFDPFHPPFIGNETVRSNSTKKPRILIADDNESNLAVFEAMLSEMDCEVETAADGLDTLAKAKSFQPDLILLDVVMPRLSGFEVCHQLKAAAATKKILVLMVTALHAPGDVEQAVKSGTDDFISKPIDKSELVNRVRVLLLIKNAS